MEKQPADRGRQAGAVELLKLLLKQKFPAAKASDLNRLDDATDRQLKKWSVRVLTATTLDEVFR